MEFYGSYKSSGARLNAWLRTSAEQSVDYPAIYEFQALNKYFIPPANGKLDLTFSDGSTYSGEWKTFFLEMSAKPGSLYGETLAQVLGGLYRSNTAAAVLHAAFAPATSGSSRRALAHRHALSHRRAQRAVPAPRPVGLAASTTTRRSLGNSAYGDGPAPKPYVGTPLFPVPDGLIQYVTFDSRVDRDNEQAQVTLYFPGPSFPPTVGSDGVAPHECTVSVATFTSGKTVVTWKLTSFSVDNDVVYFAKLAVHLAATVGGGELTIDVIGNGGGNVELSAWARQYFFGHLARNQPLERACIDVNEALTPLQVNLVANTNTLAQKFGAGYVGAGLPGRNATAAELKRWKAQMDESLLPFGTSVVSLLTDPQGPVQACINAGVFTSSSWITDLTAPNECENLELFLILVYHGDVLASCLTGPDGDDCQDELRTFMGDPGRVLGASSLASNFVTSRIDYYTGEERLFNRLVNGQVPYPTEYWVLGQNFKLDEAWQTFTTKNLEDVQYLQRGRTGSSAFSSIFKFSACPQFRLASSQAMGKAGSTYATAERYALTPEAQMMITKFKIITDGTCGSACSQLISWAYLTGSATVITYGGFEDEVMDISAYQAGNVEQWGNVWPGFSSSSLVASVLATPYETATTWWPPSFAASAFSFARTATVYPDILGPQSLWREWIILPANHHLKYWFPTNMDPMHSGRGTANSSWPALLHVYKLVAELPHKPLSTCPTEHDHEPNDVPNEAIYTALGLAIVALVLVVVGLVVFGVDKSRGYGTIGQGAVSIRDVKMAPVADATSTVSSMP